MKKLIQTILVITISSLTVFAQIPFKGLVAYYPFSGDANNFVNDDNNGVVNGATLTSDRFGNPNSAYSFDGINDNILIHSDSLLAPQGKSNYTVSLWVNYIGDGYLMQIFTGTNGTNISNYDLGIGSSKLSFINYPFYKTTTTSNIQTPINTWVHLLLSYNQIKDTVSIYQNTNLLFKAPFSNTPPKAGLISIGAVINNLAPFKGKIDDIRFYNRTLSQQEISALYNENSCSNYSSKIILPNYINTDGLIAYYPLNNDTKDYSGNNNDGINNGATLTTDRFGNTNKAYQFDGTSNYFQFSDGNLPTGNSNRSFSMWIKYQPTNSDWASILSYGTGTLKGEHNLLLINQNGILDFDYFNLNSITTDSAVKQNEWYHVVYIFDNTIGTQIYINGKLQALNLGGIALNTNNINSINTTLNGSMYIGRATQISSFPYYFKGAIDDIKIYNRALSQSEINSLFTENVCISNITVTDTLKISSISGINELPENFGLVKVYPNPTKDVINIVASNPSSNYSIQIVNNLGTVVYTGSLSNASTKVNLNTLGKGMYYIKILDISNNVLDTRKLVLE
jgi:hypothetical protein